MGRRDRDRNRDYGRRRDDRYDDDYGDDEYGYDPDDPFSAQSACTTYDVEPDPPSQSPLSSTASVSSPSPDSPKSSETSVGNSTTTSPAGTSPTGTSSAKTEPVTTNTPTSPNTQRAPNTANTSNSGLSAMAAAAAAARAALARSTASKPTTSAPIAPTTNVHTHSTPATTVSSHSTTTTAAPTAKPVTSNPLGSFLRRDSQAKETSPQPAVPSTSTSTATSAKPTAKSESSSKTPPKSAVDSTPGDKDKEKTEPVDRRRIENDPTEYGIGNYGESLALPASLSKQAKIGVAVVIGLLLSIGGGVFAFSGKPDPDDRIAMDTSKIDAISEAAPVNDAPLNLANPAESHNQADSTIANSTIADSTIADSTIADSTIADSTKTIGASRASESKHGEDALNSYNSKPLSERKTEPPVAPRGLQPSDTPPLVDDTWGSSRNGNETSSLTSESDTGTPSLPTTSELEELKGVTENPPTTSSWTPELSTGGGTANAPAEPTSFEELDAPSLPADPFGNTALSGGTNASAPVFDSLPPSLPEPVSDLPEPISSFPEPTSNETMAHPLPTPVTTPPLPAVTELAPPVPAIPETPTSDAPVTTPTTLPAPTTTSTPTAQNETEWTVPKDVASIPQTNGWSRNATNIATGTSSIVSTNSGNTTSNTTTPSVATNSTVPNSTKTSTLNTATTTKTAAPGAVTGTTYQLPRKQTIFDVARAKLGSASRWPEIYRLNRAVIGDPLREIPAGTSLVLPTR